MSDYSELKKQAEAAESALKRLDKPEDLQLELVVRGKSRPELAELTAIATFWEKSSPGAVLGLIAESERLERNRDMWKAQVERQAQEMTALRKDAERYRWLRRAGNTKAIALVAEHCLDALDEAIDASVLGETVSVPKELLV